jgi:hypothetical protein
MKDKQAIEAIAKEIDSDCIDCTYSRVCEPGNCIADLDKAAMILQTLASLGYVKLADEQKLPSYDTNTRDLMLVNTVQQDMLSVDSEGCKWVRVRVK